MHKQDEKLIEVTETINYGSRVYLKTILQDQGTLLHKEIRMILNPCHKKFLVIKETRQPNKIRQNLACQILTNKEI